ncbi:MAG: peptidoglycan DD-metalloendopeptidase family protein, partial [Calditrichia bacterium]
MKNQAIFLLFPLIFFGQVLVAQQGMGGGEYAYLQDFPCLTDEQRSEIQQTLADNIRLLNERGILLSEYSQQTVLFDWPLAPAPGLDDYGYHGISNFVDQNPAFPNQILDYNCGDRTYDLPSGYNHRGIDYFNWPFLWYKMDHDEVMVVAAAPGVIILKQDGNYDRNCGLNSDPWNAIYLQHADGSLSWYGHMKNGSLTTKSIGDSVDTGEFLGIVGSSGSSTGPHLHFEVHNQFGDLIEPYQGPCNIHNSISWWISQRPYYDSAINKLMTHSAPPVFPECPQQEILNEKNNFAPGDTVYVAAYYRDQLNSQVSEYYILRPDSSLFASWTHASNVPYYAASYWYWYLPLPMNAPQGVWTFKVLYEGQTYSHGETWCGLGS